MKWLILFRWRHQTSTWWFAIWFICIWADCLVTALKVNNFVLAKSRQEFIQPSSSTWAQWIWIKNFRRAWLTSCKPSKSKCAVYESAQSRNGQFIYSGVEDKRSIVIARFVKSSNTWHEGCCYTGCEIKAGAKEVLVFWRTHHHPIRCSPFIASRIQNALRAKVLGFSANENRSDRLRCNDTMVSSSKLSQWPRELEGLEGQRCCNSESQPANGSRAEGWCCQMESWSCPSFWIW